MLAGILTSAEILAGFSNSGVVTVAILFVVVEPIQKSRTLKFLSKVIFGRSANNYFWKLFSLFKIMAICSFLSIFLNNTPIVTMFTPIIKDWCREVGVAPSKFLIPMDFAVIAGGLGSAIGTSTTVLVQGYMSQFGIRQMEFFEIGYLGLPMTVITIVYFLIFGFCLLPNRNGLFKLIKDEGKKFLTELYVIPNSKLETKSKKEVESILKLKKLEIVEIIRTIKMEKKEEIKEESKPPQETKVEETTDNPQEDTPKIEENGEEQNSSTVTPLVEKDFNQSIHIVPVQDTEIILAGDRLILAGDVESIVELHSRTEILSWVNLNSSFEIKDMLGTSTLKQKLITPFNNPIFQTSQQIQDEKTQEIEKDESKEVDIPKTSTFREKYEKLKNQVNISEKIRRQKEEELLNEPEFFEIVLSDMNPSLHKNLIDSKFRERYDSAVLAIRSRGKMAKNIEESILHEGDTLLILSKARFFEKYSTSPDFYVVSRCNVASKEKSNYMIDFFGVKIDIWWYEFLCFPLFITMIALATAGVLDMLRSAMLCATIMILLGLISAEEAIKSIPWKLIILMACAIPLGTSILNSGLGTAFGELVLLMNPPRYILPGLIFICCVITAAFVHKEGVISIWFSLAYAMAKTLQIDPRPFAFVVAMGSSCTFLTPFCYQCNVIVQGPGGYKFWDYTIIGTGLCVLYIMFCGVFTPLVWPL